MKEKFTRALAAVLVHEGGKVNHPRDPGGRTNKGVTQRVYDAFRKRAGKPLQSVYEITDFEVRSIYELQYWNRIKGTQLPVGVDYAVFDGAVNSGPVQSAKWLQRALGVRVDGVIGEVTLAAAAAYPNKAQLINAILDRRLNFLQNLRTWDAFGKGWSRRVLDVRTTALAWAADREAVPGCFIPGCDRKATLADAPLPPQRGPADAAAGAGGITATLAQATSELSPLSGIGVVDQVILGLTILGVVVTVGAIAYRMWAARREETLMDAFDLRTEVN